MRKTTYLLLTALLAFGSFFTAANAQENLTVMQYNLLRYGAQGIGGCTPTGVTARNAWLQTIMNHVQPDILGVNEIGPNNSHINSPAENILDNILDNTSPGNYDRAEVTFNPTQDIANAFFFRKDKLALHSQAVIPHSFRNIDYYRLYYKGPGLAAGDTTWLEFVVVHLSADNATIRASQTSAIMTYLNAFGRSGNFFIMGDMNMDGASATAFQNMVAYSNANCKMNDPLNLTGSWSSNNNAKHSWSQSTRSSSGSDCGSGGGLNDRFDIILYSNAVKNNTMDVSYVANSFRVIGSPHSPNPSVPSGVTAALSPMSDHYPVALDIQISRAVSVDPASSARHIQWVSTPGTAAVFNMSVDAHDAGEWKLTATDLSGATVYESSQLMAQGDQRCSLQTEQWQNGLYLLRAQAPSGAVYHVKFMVMH